MTCTTPCHGREHRQGRDCACTTNAGRAAVGLPLQIKDDKTGWPAPDLMQDDHRGLSRWFSSKPDARRLVRESASRIEGLATETGGVNFNGGVVFPIDSDDQRPLEDDKPLTDPNTVGLWALVWIAIWGLAIVVGVASAWAKWMPRLPAISF